MSMDFYEDFARNILFKLDPEFVHDLTLKAAAFAGANKKFFSFLKNFYYFEDEVLNVSVNGLSFKTPLGLSAGFDKNGETLDFFSMTAFGFVEVGSVTLNAFQGNKKPRLFRIPEEKSVLVNLGLPNQGAEKVVERLKRVNSIPFGVSVASMNEVFESDFERAESFLDCYNIVKSVGGYHVLNVSCPNVSKGRFESPEQVNTLLKIFSRKCNVEKPLFLKFSVDLKESDVEEIVKIVKRFSFVNGFIVGNLTKEMTRLKKHSKLGGVVEKLGGSGGLSGGSVKVKSDELIKLFYQESGKTVIGVGGVFSGEDAYTKIRNGASLVEGITGMIYRGPGFAKKVCMELADLVREDGFESVSEAVGVDA